jgi:hypothetical protein
MNAAFYFLKCGAFYRIRGNHRLTGGRVQLIPEKRVCELIDEIRRNGVTLSSKISKTYADKEVISTSILRMRPARLQNGFAAFVV